MQECKDAGVQGCRGAGRWSSLAWGSGDGAGGAAQPLGEAAWAARRRMAASEPELAGQGGEAGKGAPLLLPSGRAVALGGRVVSTHRLSGASHVNPGRTQPALSSFT